MKEFPNMMFWCYNLINLIRELYSCFFFVYRTAPGTGPLDIGSGRNNKLRSTYHGSTGQRKAKVPEERSVDTNSAAASSHRTPWLSKLKSRFSTRYVSQNVQMRRKHLSLLINMIACLLSPCVSF